jgi:hypothetical protein
MDAGNVVSTVGEGASEEKSEGDGEGVARGSGETTSAELGKGSSVHGVADGDSRESVGVSDAGKIQVSIGMDFLVEIEVGAASMEVGTRLSALIESDGSTLDELLDVVEMTSIAVGVPDVVPPTPLFKFPTLSITCTVATPCFFPSPTPNPTPSAIAKATPPTMAAMSTPRLLFSPPSSSLPFSPV